MQLTDQVIRNVVQEVLAELGKRGGMPQTNGRLHAKAAGGRHGVFEDEREAVDAAARAQVEFEKQGTDARAKAITCIRRICIDQAAELGRMEFEETKSGRLEHKIEKLIV